MTDERLEILLQRHFDEVLTGEERRELERLLLESARARETFWQEAQWHSLLRQWGQESWGMKDAAALTQEAAALPQLLPAKRRQPRPRALRLLNPALRRRLSRSAGKGMATPRRSSGWIGLLAAAALLMLGVWGITPWYARELKITLPSGPATVATVTRQANGIWESSGAKIHVGSAFPAGWVRLVSGVAELRFAQGASVLLEGPVELLLQSGNSAYLKQGLLRASVPEPAHGFTIYTDGFKVVDLGTSFGCRVSPDLPAEVHVFEGKVNFQAEAADSPVHALDANQALRWENGRAKTIPARADLFPDAKTLAHPKADVAPPKNRLTRWKEGARAISYHPATWVFLDFERSDAWSRSLLNQAQKSPAPLASIAAGIVGSNWVDGRWPGKGAVEFRSPGDRLRLIVPGTLPSMTLMSWVRVDHLPARQSGLVMSEGLEQGAVQWQLHNNGTVSLGIYVGEDGPSHGWRSCDSAPMITAERLGKWVFLASVYDGHAGIVAHYLNGRPHGAKSIDLHLAARLNTLEIGNSPRPSRDSDSNLPGRMDELAILSVALKPAEIARFFESGKTE